MSPEKPEYGCDEDAVGCSRRGDGIEPEHSLDINRIVLSSIIVGHAEER